MYLGSGVSAMSVLVLSERACEYWPVAAKSNHPASNSMPYLLPSGIYGLCDDTVRPDLPVEDQAALLLAGGIQVVQLRLKRTPARAAVAACRAGGGGWRPAGRWLSDAGPRGRSAW